MRIKPFTRKRRNTDHTKEKNSPDVLIAQLDQITRYGQWADDHWANAKEVMGRESKDKTKDLFSHSLSARLNNDSRKNGPDLLKELFGAFSSYPAFHDFESPNDSNTLKRDYDNAVVEWKMYQKLAFWLCSYFLGVPQFNVWEEAALLASRLGAFPGGAFYDKMAGDVYRFERRQYAKGLRNDNDIVLVMAYTPLLLISDEKDVNYISIPEAKNQVFGPNHLGFMKEVEKLACRYLRYQAWRFFNEEMRPPIAYAVSKVSLVTALRDLTDGRFLSATYPSESDAEKRRAKKKEWIQQERMDPDSPPPPERSLPEWQAAFTQVQKESAERIRLFVRPENKECKLAVFADGATKRRGLTSCILGQEDGVITNRPNRTDQATAFCSWTEGIVLKEERQKLDNLWKNTEKGPAKYDLAEYPSAEQFVAVWFDEDVLKHCKIPSLSTGRDMKT